MQIRVAIVTVHQSSCFTFADSSRPPKKHACIRTSNCKANVAVYISDNFRTYLWLRSNIVFEKWKEEVKNHFKLINPSLLFSQIITVFEKKPNLSYKSSKPLNLSGDLCDLFLATAGNSNTPPDLLVIYRHKLYLEKISNFKGQMPTFWRLIHYRNFSTFNLLRNTIFWRLPTEYLGSPILGCNHL